MNVSVKRKHAVYLTNMDTANVTNIMMLIPAIKSTNTASGNVENFFHSTHWPAIVELNTDLHYTYNFCMLYV